MITAATKQTRDAIRARFPAEFASGVFYPLGVYNRRKIAGTTTWSQHAWGNAEDIGVAVGSRGPGGPGDQLAAWLRAERRAGNLPVGLILWRVRNHFGHLHIEGVPKMTGTPPDGTTRGDIDMDALKELVTGIQKGLLSAGYQLPRFGADGLWGVETLAAFTAAMNDAQRTQQALAEHEHLLAETTGGIVSGA